MDHSAREVATLFGGGALAYPRSVSLMIARGPLSPHRAGWFSEPVPREVVYVEPHPRRVQAVLDGRIVIDTERALLVHRPQRTLAYAFPADGVSELPHEPAP